MSYEFPQPDELDEATDALQQWILEHPDPNACGVAIHRNVAAVAVYWRGTAPEELRRLASEQPVRVIFVPTPYSGAELDPIARSVVGENAGVVDVAGPTHDYAGIGVVLRTTAPPDTLERLRSKYNVPIVLEGFGDSVDLAAR